MVPERGDGVTARAQQQQVKENRYRSFRHVRLRSTGGSFSPAYLPFPRLVQISTLLTSAEVDVCFGNLTLVVTLPFPRTSVSRLRKMQQEEISKVSEEVVKSYCLPPPIHHFSRGYVTYVTLCYVQSRTTPRPPTN